ncbi:MAG: hypothetical protein A2W35_20905 [Chloroflexi bacterium RBG_16_57_11]|nr:MAG: hypothetical protein A2W35_20905 [Chloroflexi bacterium RBG_16_57_11]
MNIDPGLVIVIVAVLIFYLRLIVLQRQRAKQLAPKPAASKKKVKGHPITPGAPYTIITQNRRDRVIGIVGAVAILVGIFLNLGLLPFPLAQTYWWLPTALGIVAFSWLFSP